MPRRSLRSAVVRSIDRAAIERAVAALARDLYARHPEIVRIIWFGSWIGGLPSPRSDVDLCIVVRASDVRRHERAARYLPDRFPTGLDIVVYTVAEHAALVERLPRWAAAIAAGREIPRVTGASAAASERAGGDGVVVGSKMAGELGKDG